MATSRATIEHWLDTLYAGDDLTHMIVVCDTFDYQDYPVYVSTGESASDIAGQVETADMTRVIEVYSKSRSRELQMAEHRAIHYD